MPKHAHPEEVVAHALRLLAAGVPQWHVAVELGVAQSSVWRCGAAAGIARFKPGRRRVSADRARSQGATAGTTCR